MAEVVVSRHFFADILRLITELRLTPDAAPALGVRLSCGRAKTKRQVRLDHNQLGIVRSATRPCHWLYCAGASRQRGNLNLNKQEIRELSV